MHRWLLVLLVLGSYMLLLPVEHWGTRLLQTVSIFVLAGWLALWYEQAMED
jgi:hypothetical protein